MRDEPEPRTLGEGARVLAWIALVEGRYGDAIREALTAGDRYSGDLVGGLGLAGRAALWSGDAATAADCLRRLREFSRSESAVEVACWNLQAGIDAAEGRRPEAIAGFHAAMEGWRGLGLDFDRALCALDAVSLLDPADDVTAELAGEGRAILERLGARPFLEQLDRALDDGPRVASAAARRSGEAP